MVTPDGAQVFARDTSNQAITSLVVAFAPARLTTGGRTLPVYILKGPPEVADLQPHDY